MRCNNKLFKSKNSLKIKKIKLISKLKKRFIKEVNCVRYAT